MGKHQNKINFFYIYFNNIKKLGKERNWRNFICFRKVSLSIYYSLIFLRNTSPKYAFFVLNRVGPNNLIQLLNVDIELQIQGDFIICKNELDTILGIWLFQVDEVNKIYNLLEKYYYYYNYY